MNRVQFCLVVLSSLICPVVGWSAFTITPEPLLETCAITTDYTTSTANVELEYKESSSGTWKEALPLIWDANTNSFAGSIINLEEETDYDVRVTYFVGGIQDDQATASFSTWTKTENLPIKTLYSITDLYDPAVDSQLYIPSGGSSTEGYIKIVGDGTTVIDAGYLHDHALKIANWKGYIIFENLIIRGGRLHGVYGYKNHHIRFVNCDIAGWGREPKSTRNSSGRWEEVGTSTEINYDAGFYFMRSGIILVERCYVHDPRPTANAWSDGSGRVHPKGPTAFYAYGNNTTDSSRGQIVVRYNDFIGSDAKRWNDVIEGDNNPSAGGGFTRNSDIYGNYLTYGNDDGTELDGGQQNVKFFRNRVEGTLTGVSVAPTRTGPSYVFQNLFVNLEDIRGWRNSAIKAGFGPHATLGLATFLAFNNTSYNSSNGVGGSNGSVGYQARTRNNIFYTWSSWSGAKWGIIDATQDPLSDYDYDMIVNTAYANGTYPSVGQLYAAAGQEPNGIFNQVPDFVSIADGLYQLAPGSDGIDAGEILPNFTDGYVGSAPDMGAYEYGTDRILPARPINQRASVNEVKVMYSPDSYSTSATVTVTNPDAAIGYKILKNDAHDWVQVSPSVGTLPASGSVTFTVAIDDTIAADRTPSNYNSNASDSILRGAFLVKLDNGFSLPISVYGEETDDPPPVVNAPDDIIIDNTAASGVTKVGTWTASTTGVYYDTNFIHDENAGKGSKSVTFTPTIELAGTYEVYMWWSAASNRSTNTPVDINHENGTDYLLVDQSENGGEWVLLGTYAFEAGTSGNVVISNGGTNGKYVIADAVRFVYIPSDIIQDNTDATGVTFVGSWADSTYESGYYGVNYTYDLNAGKGSKSVAYAPDIVKSGAYEVFMRWTSSSNRASNVPVSVIHASGTESLVVDQRFDGGAWVSLGAYNFDEDDSGSLLIETTGTAKPVIADSVRFSYLGVPDIVMDTTDATGISSVDAWTYSNSASGYLGAGYIHDGNVDKGAKSITYTPNIAVAGDYEVFATWTSATNRDDNVPIEINDTTGASTVYVNQQTNGAVWVSLGTYNFDTGMAGSITIKNDGTTAYVIADGIRLTAVAP